MKYILQRFGRTFFESDSFDELDSTFMRLIGRLAIHYMSENKAINDKWYDVFYCEDGYTLLIKK